MALTQSWPGVSGKAQVLDVRKDLLGIVARSGIIPDLVTTSLLNKTNSMTPTLRQFYLAIVRANSGADGAQLISNDGPTGPVPAFDPAPQTGSRLDLFWVKAFDPLYESEGDVRYGITPGVPTTGTAVADRASMPAGAVELGTMLIPAGATTLQSANVVWTETFRYGALRGGSFLYRTFDDMVNDRANAPRGQIASLISDGSLWEKVGVGWRAVLVPDVNRVRLRYYDSTSAPTTSTEVFTMVIPATPVEQLLSTTVTGTAGAVANTGGTAAIRFEVDGPTVSGLVPPNSNLRTNPYRPYFSANQATTIARSFYIRVAAGQTVTIRGFFDMSVSGEAHLALETRLLLQGEY